jgi:photosystem II stability/assembly factor-like uncharacterized protein
MKLNTTLFASLSIAFSIVLSSFLLLSIEHEQHAPIPSSGGTRYLQKGEEDESEEQKRRLQWIERIHRSADGVDWRQIEHQNRLNRYERRKQLSQQKADAQSVSIASGLLLGSWREKGSANCAGRSHFADYDTTSGLIYLASAGGNIWKGTLEGENWQVLNDDFQFESISLLRVLHSGKEMSIVAASDAKFIYYSQDDGATWEISTGLESLTNWDERIIRTQVADDSVHTIYSLVSERIAPSNTRVVSLYASVDLGVSFNRLVTLPNSSGANIDGFDLWCPQYGLTNPRLIKNDQAYSYDPATNTINLLGTLPDSPSGFVMLTGHLAANGDVYTYAYVNEKIYRSSDGGDTWELRTNLNKSPFYKTSFSCSVNTPDLLFFGDIECHRSVNGGSGWTKINDWYDYYDNVFSKLHADIPSVNCLRNSNGDEFFLINTDGGIYYSPDGFQVDNRGLEGLNISQYYSSLTAIFDTNYVFLGSQDQGFQRAYDNHPSGLLYPDQVVSGDYGHIVSGDEGNSIWMVYPGFAIFYPDATAYSDITWDFDGNNSFWIPPLTPDPDYPDIVYMANGSRVTKLNQSGSTINVENLPIVFQGAVSAIAISPLDFNYWYVLTETGKFYRSEDRGETWAISNVSNSPDGHYLYGADIYPSRKTLGEVWICGSGYSNPPVYHSVNHGQNFTSRATGLPSTLVFNIAGAPNDEFLFAATESGPYVFVPETNQWHELAADVAPDQTYWSVEYIDQMKVARFVTYGRGAWDFRIQNILSVQELPTLEARVFPNPAQESFQVQLEAGQAAVFTLYSMEGKTVFQREMQSGNNQIPTGNLSSGVYLYSIKSKQKSKSGRLIIAH